MTTVRIPPQKRHFSDFGWLQTYWLFSFSEYYDPQNIQFGALRVFNDDSVLPEEGFPTHPHHEMEIVTIVLEGEMTHADSMGNQTVIREGDVQRMSAGTGLTHSEYNRGDKPVRFYQIWIFPDRHDLQPSYDQKHFEPEQWHNHLLPIASGQGRPGAVTFNTDATIYRCELDAGHSIIHQTGPDRRVFIYITHGTLDFEGEISIPGEQIRIDPTEPFSLHARTQCQFILIDVPSCRGYGYDRKILRGIGN